MHRCICFVACCFVCLFVLVAIPVTVVFDSVGVSLYHSRKMRATFKFSSGI